MNTGQDLSAPRFPKPLDTIVTALGIALFIVFAAVGVNQADDRKAVTGNSQRNAAVVHDEEIKLNSAGLYVAEPAISKAVNENNHENASVVSGPPAKESTNSAEANKSKKDTRSDKKAENLNAAEKRSRIQQSAAFLD